ncbi:N-acetylglucosamine kinase [Paenibacillus elgii]|uniref:N-acetylglucosamine kinase n=1 Tax=Paenibacillus elgii TaxID=189691 RepID=UPI000248D427|nr:BadF/BadG/BcrA/BcrD ATPase family protein [Paenibacillus elgii]
MKYYLGMDAGGSKTYAVITDETGRLVAAGKGGPGNHQIDRDTAAQSFRQAVAQALGQAGLREQDIAAACFGLAGADREADFRILRPMIAELGLPGSDVVCDTVIALRAGTSKPYGVVGICGSGTNCVGMSPSGEMYQCGGFGYPYGDFGGGGDLAAEAFRAVIRAWEGREEETLLTALVTKELGYPSVEHMFHHFLDHALTAPLELTPLLFEAAAQGDRVATRILRMQGTELGLAARAVIRRLGMQRETFDLVLAGSVLTRGDGQFIHPYIVELVQPEAPGCRLQVLDVEPVVGAILLAMEKDGTTVSEPVQEQVRRISDLKGVLAGG